MSIFESFAPNALMDWGKVFSGDLVDPYSGKSWLLSGTTKRTGDMFDQSACTMAGATVASLKNITLNQAAWSLCFFVNDIGTGSSGKYIGMRKAGTSGNSDPTVNLSNYFDVVVVDGAQCVTRFLLNGDNNQAMWLRFPRVTNARLMLTVIYTAGALSLWGNGALQSSLNMPSFGINTVDLMLGSGDSNVANDFKLSGTSGNMALFNRVLTEQEIKSMWQSVLPVPAIPYDYLVWQINQDNRKFAGGVVKPQISVSRVDGTAGNGSLVGTVKIQISPTQQVPASRKVRIFDTASGKLLIETWSDAKTGAWRIDGLALNRLFTVLSHDHEKEFNAVTADYRYAEVL